jgi:alkylated DNA repair dioxygenase AlkB
LSTLPEGYAYAPEFISLAEEEVLLEQIKAQPLHEAEYKQYTAKRRILSFGSEYDFSANELLPGPALPEFLLPLRAKVARWVGVAADDFAHALLTHYPAGTALGWHRDVPNFELVTGVSLLGACRMRFRPYPATKSAKSLAIELEPRSVYVLRGNVRWRWQHSIPATPGERYSVTFRTLRQSASC